VLPMTIVRTLPPGTAGGVVGEARALTFATGNEHALVRLATGERALVSGGPGGIDFGVGQVTRIIGHSHPYGSLSDILCFEPVVSSIVSKRSINHVLPWRAVGAHANKSRTWLNNRLRWFDLQRQCAWPLGHGR
jgi:hypothetical protein